VVPPERSVGNPALNPRSEPDASGREEWTDTDQLEWEEFFDSTYEALVTAGVMWGGNQQDAEDAAEFALTELRRRWRTVINRAAYARRVAKNRVANEQKRDRDRVAKLIRKGEYVTDVTDDHGLTEYEDEQWVRQLLDRLPPQQRLVMEHLYSGLSYTEIAETLGKKEPTIRKHLQLARERLREELRKQQERPSPVRAAAPAPRKEVER